MHGNAGRVPWHALPAEIRVRVQELARDRYAGLNYQHLSEKLADDVGMELHRTTVRKVLLFNFRLSSHLGVACSRASSVAPPC
jgi:hypothetical protein